MKLIAILACLFVAASADATVTHPWYDATTTDTMTDEVTPIVGSVVTDGKPFGNKLLVSFVCKAKTGKLAFGAKADGLGLISMDRLEFRMRVDKGSVWSDLGGGHNRAILFDSEAHRFASELIEGNTLRVQVATTNGHSVDFVVPLQGFTAAFRASLPASCRQSP